MYIAHLVKLPKLKVKDMALVKWIVLASHEEVKQCVKDVSLQQRHDKEAPIVCRVENAKLLDKVRVVLLLRLRFGVEADRVKATFVEDNIEGIVRVVELKEVAFSVCDTRNVTLIHFLHTLWYKVNRCDIGLVHASAEFL